MKKGSYMKTVLVIAIIVAVICFGGLATVVVGDAKAKADVARQLSLGEKYLDELNYSQAILAFEKAIKLDDKNVEAYKKLAIAYKEDGQIENAIDILEKGYSKTNDESLNDMLVVYEEIKDGEDEEKQLLKETQKPSDAPRKSSTPTIRPTHSALPQKTPYKAPTVRPAIKETPIPKRTQTVVPTDKPTKQPTKEPESSPQKSKNALAHEAYLAMLKEKDCKTMNALQEGCHYKKNQDGSIGLDNGEETTGTFLSLIDVNNDGIDELLCSFTGGEDIAASMNIYTYQEGRIKLIGTIDTDYPIFTKEYIKWLEEDPHTEYEEPFGKPKEGKSLLFYNGAKNMMYSAMYNSFGDTNTNLFAYRVSSRSVTQIYRCGSDYDYDHTVYKTGEDYKEVSKKTYEKYIKKNFDSIGTRIKFYAYKEFMERYDGE